MCKCGHGHDKHDENGCQTEACYCCWYRPVAGRRKRLLEKYGSLKGYTMPLVSDPDE